MKYVHTYIVLLLFGGGHLGGDDTSTLVNSARNSNRSAIESIQTCSCNFEATTVYSYGKKMTTPLTQYWQSGSVVRQFTRDGNIWSDTICADGIRKVIKCNYDENRRLVVSGHVSQYDGTRLGIDDLREHCLFTFLGTDTAGDPQRMVLFDELLMRVQHKILSASKIVESGTNAVKVDIKFAKPVSTTTYWFDVNKNYLIRKIQIDFTSSFSNKREIYTREIQKFHNAGNGIYFPELIVVTHTSEEGKVYSTTKANVSDIKINRQIPVKNMTMIFPPGISVTNAISGKVGKVNSDGKVVDTAEDIPQPGPPLTGTANREQPIVYEKTVEREPLVNRILPYLSLVLLVGAGVVFFYRRRMQRKLEQES